MLKSIDICPSLSSALPAGRRKTKGLMVLQGMAKRLTGIQRHFPFQQGDNPVNTGKGGEFAIAGDGRNAGTPEKSRVAGGKQQISRVSPAPLRQRLTGILRISKNSITTPEWRNERGQGYRYRCCLVCYD